MQELEGALVHIRKVYYSQVVGFSSTRMEIILPDLVKSNTRGKLTIVAFKTNKALNKAIEQLEKERIKFDVELKDSTNLLYCTTFAARRYIQKLIKKDAFSRLQDGYIFLSNVDKFDANAYGIWLLYQQFMTGKVSLVALTVSPYTWLPTKPDLYTINDSKINIVYQPNINDLVSNLVQPFVLIGNTKAKNFRMIKADSEIKNYNVECVVDAGFISNSVTKHEAYLREDVISKGTIYRGISRAAFDKLKDRSPASKIGDTRKVLTGLFSAGFSEVEKFVTREFASNLEEVRKLSSEGFDKKLLSIVANLPLDFDASIFLSLWMMHVVVLAKDGASFFKIAINNYYGALVAVLIDTRPDYGNLKEYVGRDDLETLLNFWTAIMQSTNNTAYDLTQKKVGYLTSWCRSQQLDVGKVMQLCKKVQKTLLYVMDLQTLKDYPSIVSFDQRTSSINKIREMLVQIYPRDLAGKYHLKKMLPELPWNKVDKDTPITILYRYEKEVYIYIVQAKLRNTVEAVENVDELTQLLNEMDNMSL